MKKIYESPTYEIIPVSDICVCCGAYAGEGRQICLSCESEVKR